MARALPRSFSSVWYSSDVSVHGVLLMPPPFYRSGITEDATFRYFATVIDRNAQQVHVRARVRRAEDPVNVEARCGARGREALGQHDLEGIAAADVLLRGRDTRQVPRLRRPSRDVRDGSEIV